MDFLTLIGLVSAICSILSFVTLQIFKSHRWLWAVIVFILTFASGYAIHYNSELERIKNIHRQATTIYEHYDINSTNNNEFIQEAIVFLEENRDKYPDSYKRAMQIYSDMNRSEFKYDPEPAKKIRGIIKGVATLNND